VLNTLEVPPCTIPRATLSFALSKGGYGVVFVKLMWAGGSRMLLRRRG